MTATSKRLLLVAPTCDPDDVGESWVSAQWVATLAQRHDVTLLTYSKRDRLPLAHHFPHARVVEWREPRLVGRSERLNSMLKPGYVPFYLKARRWIREALASGEHFDLGHQLSPVALRYPSPLTGLGLPHVIGPTGGSIAAPAGFSSDEGAWYVRLRRLDDLRLTHDPMLRRSYAGADCVIGIGPYVRDILGDIPLRRFHAMGDTGVSSLPPPVDRRGRTGTVRVLFVGRVVRSKGVRNAIRAFALLGDVEARLDVIGRGADLETCGRLVESLGLQDRVTLHGFVAREQVEASYAAADVFLFPSYREPGGIVVAEAMSYGLPCHRVRPRRAGRHHRRPVGHPGRAGRGIGVRARAGRRAGTSGARPRAAALAGGRRPHPDRRRSGCGSARPTRSTGSTTRCWTRRVRVPAQRGNA